MSLSIDRSVAAKHRLAVDLYPTIGRRAQGEPAWQVIVHGRIVRPWHDNLQRRLVMKLLRQTMRIDVEDLQTEIFQERMDPFWVKPCRQRRVQVHVEGAVYHLRNRSHGSGHFHAAIRVPFALSRHTDSEPGNMILATDQGQAVDPSATTARLIPPCGTSVISDIDDTIKVSEVFNRRQMFRNTFLNPYRPVSGMAEAYRGWATQGCEFHYVSSSPWQLYRPLELFLNEHGFPAGSFHLRAFRLRDPNNLQLMTAGVRSKRKAIRSLLKWYPFRQFVLIGDGGQKDAKLYAKLAKKHGHQIAQICIRRLPSVNGYVERDVRHALRELPRCKWRLFEHGGELTDLQAGSHLGWNI